MEITFFSHLERIINLVGCVRYFYMSGGDWKKQALHQPK
jgi:hypothetical protein